MTRYLLDTKILSDALKPQPNVAIGGWIERQAGADLFISVLTVAELRRGVLQRAPGRRRDELEAWFAGPAGPLALFHGRILSFEPAAALEWARIMTEGTAAGSPRSALDTIIAAIAVVNQCIVVTANERHFLGAVEIFNPLKT
jgi:hypothetical protein